MTNENIQNPDAGQVNAQGQMDEALAEGVIGDKVDPVPDEAYTVEGVTVEHGQPPIMPDILPPPEAPPVPPVQAQPSPPTTAPAAPPTEPPAAPKASASDTNPS